jgi:hypothetical protein
MTLQVPVERVVFKEKIREKIIKIHVEKEHPETSVGFALEGIFIWIDRLIDR